MKTITRCGLQNSSCPGSSLGTHYPEGPPSAALPAIKTSRRLAYVLLLLAGLAALPGQSFAAKPAPPPPPPPPPVRYEIKFFGPTTVGSVWDLNDAGQIVGSFRTPDGENHAFLYNSETDAMLDLHNAYSPGAPIPEGWTIANAKSINKDCVIVGKLVEIGNPNGIPSIPYILDPQGANAMVLLPYFGPDGSTTGYLSINDNWDILTIHNNADGSRGAYVFNYREYLLGNNTLQVVPGTLTNGGRTISLNNPTATRAAQVSGKFSNGTVFRWTIGPNSGLETFSGLTGPMVQDINDAGAICGETTKQGKRYPMRLGSTPELLTGVPNYLTESINNNADVLLYSSATSLIFHNELDYFDLDKLVTGTDADVAAWLAGAPYPTLLNNRDSTGFGQIAGSIKFPDGTQCGFVLTPIAP